ncbi:MAG: dephospho-CoA kinase [Flavobacteriales bacterium]|nr:dephospho-CoA kinase [Flavobacteriales bacterium]
MLTCSHDRMIPCPCQRFSLPAELGAEEHRGSQILRVLNVPVFEADRAGREILSSPEVQRSIIDRFGERMLKDGSIDRKELAQVVFHDKGALTDLNAIVHPMVQREFQRWVERQRAPYVVMEAAILTDRARFDHVVVVNAPRSCASSGYTGAME